MDEAGGKLDRALKRLEAAIDGYGERHRQGDSAKNAELAQELSQLRGDYARLKRTKDQVAQRLDAAIGKLKQALEV